MNKILVPCDFSDTSKNAKNYAIQLAKYLSSEIILLHITQLPVMSSEFGLIPYEIPNNNSDNNNLLKEIAEKIKQEEPLISKISYYSEIGIATDTIIEYSQKHQVTFTVMGISGHGNKLMKAFLGSTAVNVSKKIETPLIIVPPNFSYKKIENIAYACDYDKNIESNSSLMQLKHISTLLDSKLHVLHVVPTNHDLSIKESKIDCYIEQSLDSTSHNTYMISDNNVSEGLLEFIEHHDIDLIVMEPKNHSFFHNLFYPSITNEIAFYSPVPVLTIHG